ncbi:protein of unknown function [Poseidonocella pacifica]|uniref:eCIS core domain-containing protein n=2 Tax=Poseidonocella pacifica TaxID=871651 RepID=A0A1I0VQJ6_9RHOB|nr:protein of unknown function [Poseidonocella pacifica]
MLSDHKPGTARRGSAPMRSAQTQGAPARPAPVSQGRCACGGGCPACQGNALTAAETAAHREPRRGGALPAPVRDTAGEPGRPLEAGPRALFEARHGRDLGHLRVHNDGPAAASAAAVGARAWSSGMHIAFAEGAYRPDTPAGQSLLAHEIAHTTEGPTGAPGLRKDDAPADTPIAANAMVGLPAGSEIVITHSMNETILNIVRSQAPEVAGALSAVSDKRATVVTADASTVEIRFAAPATLPGSGGQAATTIRDLTLRLARTDAGTFDFEISGQIGEDARTLHVERGLSVEARDGAFVLSEGSSPHLRLTPAGSATGQAQIEAFTAPYLAGQPALVRSFAPETVGLRLEGLAPASEGTGDVEQAAQRAINRAASQRRAPRSTFTLGGGIAGRFAGQSVSPMIAATYRYAFTPTELGSLVQVPLQFDLMYVPTTSVIGALSSGIGGSLSSLDVPINVRLTGGLGAGSIDAGPDPAAPDGGRLRDTVLGPTIGLGIGYESGWFRIEVRGDVLFNLLPGPAPTVLPTGTLGLGGSF